MTKDQEVGGSNPPGCTRPKTLFHERFMFNFELLLFLNDQNNFRIDTDLDIYLYFDESICSRGKSKLE